MTIYMDYAAATPIDSQVLKAMTPYFSAEFYNPSAGYLAAKKARQSLERARADIADCLGSRPTEVIFTAGATEANNLAIQGVMDAFPGGEVLASAIEHESVLEPAKLFKHRLIPVTPEGLTDLDKLEKMISHQTVLVSAGMVNNEIGSLQPMAKIADLIKRIKQQRSTSEPPLYLHTDAAQAANFQDLHVSRLGADLMSINGGKIYGPKQSGALYVKAGTKLQPLVVGGGQEFNLRSGTENVPGAIGLAAALKMAQASKKPESMRIDALRDKFIKELAIRAPSARINGSDKHTAPHIVSVTFPGQDNERLMMELDEAGVQAATGSACSASSQEPSHALSAIGLSTAAVRSTLRFSFGRATTDGDIDKVIGLLSKLTVA